MRKIVTEMAVYNTEMMIGKVRRFLQAALNAIIPVTISKTNGMNNLKKNSLILPSGSVPPPNP